jgi:hypothetical protein
MSSHDARSSMNEPTIDLQGIAGKTLQEIEGLDIPLLNAPKSDSEGEPDER